MTRGRILSVNAEVLPEWREVEGEVCRVNGKPITWSITSLRQRITRWRMVGCR